MTIVSKVGFHSIGSNRRGYRECLQRIKDAGRELSLVKCRDDFGAITEPLQLWPDTVTIGAVTAWDDARYDVSEAFTAITALAKMNPGVKYWEYYNERDGEYAQQADLYIALLPRLAQAGIGLCMFNCASGTPHYPQDDPVPYREISRACAFAKAHNYKAILGLHEYQYDGPTIGRYKVLADYLTAHGSLIPIAVTEYGWETCANQEQKYLAWVKANDTQYIGDDRVMGCALWTLGGRGWGMSNYQNVLPQLGEYIATVQPPAPLPDPEPVTKTIEQRVAELEERVTRLERK